MTRSPILLALLLVTNVVACGGKKASDERRAPPPPPPPAAIDAGPTTTVDAAAPGTAAAPGGAAAPAKLVAIAEGAACPSNMRRVTDVPMALDGARLSFKRSRGGGCPTRPTYTAYYRKASPMPVLVCEDIEADTCEMYIMDEPVSFDLTAALAAAGATTAVLAK